MAAAGTQCYEARRGRQGRGGERVRPRGKEKIIPSFTRQTRGPQMDAGGRSLDFSLSCEL